MTTKSILRYIWCVILVAGCQTMPVVAAESLFSIGLQPEKQIYLKGEPVALIMTITYLGANPIDVPHPLYKQGYEERFEVRITGRRDFRSLITAEEAAQELAARARSLRRLHFDPGVAVKRTNWYHCWPKVGTNYPDGLMFADASEYAIRGSILWEATTTTAESSVAVVEPSLISDKQAYEWMVSSGSLCHLGHLWEYTRDPKEYGREAARFRELRVKYGDSTFAAFLDRTYMSASNLLRNVNVRHMELLGDKPGAVTRPR